MIYKRLGNWHLDVTIHSIRYREALHTTDKREALALEKKRISEIQQGKAASKSGRDFARKPFSESAVMYQAERKPHVAERTMQFEAERLRPLCASFGEKPLLRFKAEDVVGYQSARLKHGISGRTVNMEVGVLRRMLKRAKVWNTIAEDVKMLPESNAEVGRVLTPEVKQRLFDMAGSKAEWTVAHCAAVLAVSTTCRGVEIKNLRWHDIDFLNRVVAICRSKTSAGLRNIPLNGDAMSALARLRERAEALGSSAPDHYVFPSCEHQIDPTKPHKSFRTAWRKLTTAAGLPGFRFHDLRHQAITEIAEAGVSDATLMALAGHMSRKMLEHYSHVRMAAKRTAIDGLESGLISVKPKLPTIAEQVN